MTRSTSDVAACCSRDWESSRASCASFLFDPALAKLGRRATLRALGRLDPAVAGRRFFIDAQAAAQTLRAEMQRTPRSAARENLAVPWLRPPAGKASYAFELDLWKGLAAVLGGGFGSPTTTLRKTARHQGAAGPQHVRNPGAGPAIGGTCALTTRSAPTTRPNLINL